MKTFDRVLFLAYYFPPLGGGGTQRTLKFVRYLPEFGWQPHVLTVRDAHYLVNDKSLLQDIPPDLPITATPAFLPARFFRKALNHPPRASNEIQSVMLRAFSFTKKLFYSFCFIPDEHIGWLPFALRAGKRLLRQRDFKIIYSSGLPNTAHLIAQRLARKTGKPWVADLRDLWDQYPESYNPFGWKWRSRLDDWLERRVLARADHLIVVSDEMKRQLLQKLPALSAERITVITNGYDPNDFVSVTPIRAPNRFVLLHSGTLFQWRTLQPILHAMQLLFQNHPECRAQFLLKLLGIVPAAEREAIRQAGFSEQVETLDYLPYREALAHVRGADLLLLLIGNLPYAANMLTSKLFDYLGAQRPILVIGPKGEIHKFIEREQLGVAFEANEAALIAETLSRWMRQWRAQELPDGKTAAPDYQRRHLTERLATIFEAVTARHTHNPDELQPKKNFVSGFSGLSGYGTGSSD